MIHYVYIPGFGGHFDGARQNALGRWKTETTRATFVAMHWLDKTETFEQKYERIVAVIASIPDEHEIHLVGESAGGAMALYAFLQQRDRVVSLTTVCGYNHSADGIGLSVRIGHPAFYPLVQNVDAEIKTLTDSGRHRITTLYSRHDYVVRSRYTHIEGARDIVLGTPGHFLTIARVLLQGPRSMQL